MKANFIDVEGIRTRYISSGSGAPVLMLHGIGMSADCFHRNIDELAATGRSVFALDMLGHGFTEYQGFSDVNPLRSLSRHALAFIHQLGLENVDVIGSSLGAGIAVECYLLQPEKIRSCVLAGSSTPFVSAETLGVGLSKARQNASASLRSGTLEDLRKRLRFLVHDDSSMSEELLAVQMTSYALEDRERAYNELVEGVLAGAGQANFTPADRLGDVNIPVLAIAGRDDPRSPLDAVERGVARLPQGQLIIYDNCGHFPFLEYPERFASDITAFFNGENLTDATSSEFLQNTLSEDQL